MNPELDCVFQNEFAPAPVIKRAGYCADYRSSTDVDLARKPEVVAVRFEDVAVQPIAPDKKA